MSYEPVLPPDRGYQAVYAVRPPFLGTAVTGFVLAIIGFVLSLVPWVGLLLALAGVILGHVSLYRLARNPRPHSGKGLAIASLPIGYLAIIGSLFVAAMFSAVLARLSEG